MPDPVTAVVGAATVGKALLGSSSAKKAANQQAKQADAGVAEQTAAREQMRQLLDPYVKAGTPALQGMMDIAGLSGDTAQGAAVSDLEASPIFQALAAQGEDAILQNASATGGLRGGNVQGALAQFRPALLNQFIEQQYSRLGGLTQLGQNSAAGVGTAGMNSANSISELLADKGAAKAGGTIASGKAWGNALGSVSGLLAGGAF